MADKNEHEEIFEQIGHIDYNELTEGKGLVQSISEQKPEIKLSVEALKPVRDNEVVGWKF